MTPKWCEDDLRVPKSDGEMPNSWEYDNISPHISKATSFGEGGSIWTHMAHGSGPLLDSSD